MARTGGSLSRLTLRWRTGLIFLTVGSALPFDRLVRLVDDMLPRLELDQPVFAQIGHGKYRPRHFDYIDFLSKDRFKYVFAESSLIISHAGIGTISEALNARKSILVMPRQKAFGELVDDHQILTAQKFESLGHILSFSNSEQFLIKMNESKNFVPRARTANVEGISKAISTFLNTIK